MHVSLRFLPALLIVAAVTSPLHAQTPVSGVGKSKSFASNMPTELGGKTLKQWIIEITSADPSRRENAIRTIPLLRGAEEAIPALLDRVDRDPDSSPRVNAVMALGAIEFRKEEDVARAVRSLANRLKDTQSIIRFQAALVLGRFGGRARPALAELIEATKDPGSWEIRKAAVFAVARAASDTAQPVSPQAIAALVARLSPSLESSSLVRLEATMSVHSIGKLSPSDNIKVVNALKSARSDKDKMVSIWAIVGLMVHNNELTKQDMAVLIKFLQSPELPHRTHAARAIGTIASVGNPGPVIEPAVPMLIDILERDKEELGQIAAIWALGRIGAPAQPALKRLNGMLQEKDISEEGKTFIREAITIIQGKAKN